MLRTVFIYFGFLSSLIPHYIYAIPPPPPSGNYLNRDRLIDFESLGSDEDEKEECSDSLPYGNGKYGWDMDKIRSMGYVTLTKEQPSFQLTDDTAVRIPNLSVDTGKSVLATIYFGNAYSQQAVYIDSLAIGYDSFLEFDITALGNAAGAYIFTRSDYSFIIDQIGFYDPFLGGRYGAVSTYWGNGVYCIAMNEFKKWSPPMVPEPTTYGAGLMGLGVAVACYRSRLCRRKAARINGVIG